MIIRRMRSIIINFKPASSTSAKLTGFEPNASQRASTRQWLASRTPAGVAKMSNDLQRPESAWRLGTAWVHLNAAQPHLSGTHRPFRGRWNSQGVPSCDKPPRTKIKPRYFGRTLSISVLFPTPSYKIFILHLGGRNLAQQRTCTLACAINHVIYLSISALHLENTPWLQRYTAAMGGQ
ncbi:hypothetical protein C8R45DRAFT_212970 [Mycena sanguinolenta]|nr:hypothetical protein C8R45DRAFT_212970 [Mycena sanguinolenta]